jgi:hypothetical protein
MKKWILECYKTTTMSRKINIADNKGRNAEVVFRSFTKKPLIKTVTQEGKESQTVRVLKSVANNSYDCLLKENGSDDGIVESLINSDPEFNPLWTGYFISETSKVYINSDLKPVFKIQKTEAIFLPDGTLKEERTPKETIANILAEYPVKSAGKFLPKKDIYNKFVFSKKYQLSHNNGLTFDFLFEMAKELQEKDAMIMLAGGVKGNEPLVFQDGGKTYRAFLEGRIRGNSYILLIHLSNLELKGISK